MKNSKLIGYLVLCVMFSVLQVYAFVARPTPAGGNYTLVVEGYDWGPAASKAIIRLDAPASSVEMADYQVDVNRSTDCFEIPAAQRTGSRNVVFAYISDEKGNRVKEGSHATLVLYVAPNQILGSPIQYSNNPKCRGNNWINYQLSIKNTKTGQVWDTEKSRIRPLTDEFNVSGKFEYEPGKTMSFADFAPKNRVGKAPLIIWLHGGGEGGTDPTIAMIGNKAINYASPEIQTYFGGAYVLVPQCPGAWMHDKDGKTQPGSGEDVYHVGLMALIKDYVAKHPDIDTKRIYVGGCSNGGYMSLKLILKEPGYFAAGYISALAYQSQYISDAQMKAIKNVPIWFVHCKEDNTTKPDVTVLPVYDRLKKLGNKNVHLSYYEHVTDLTGMYGGQNYYYNGHWSWVYSHANAAQLDFDGKPVVFKGRPVTIMEWLAGQKKK